MNILENNKTSFIFIKDLESQTHIKFINIIYYHDGKLVEEEKLLME